MLSIKQSLDNILSFQQEAHKLPPREQHIQDVLKIVKRISRLCIIMQYSENEETYSLLMEQYESNIRLLKELLNDY